MSLFVSPSLPPSLSLPLSFSYSLSLPLSNPLSLSRFALYLFRSLSFFSLSFTLSICIHIFSLFLLSLSLFLSLFSLSTSLYSPLPNMHLGEVRGVLTPLERSDPPLNIRSFHYRTEGKNPVFAFGQRAKLSPRA
jgi:hypothetical protein